MIEPYLFATYLCRHKDNYNLQLETQSIMYRKLL